MQMYIQIQAPDDLTAIQPSEPFENSKMPKGWLLFS